jgi:hypothetical protein
MAMPQQITIVRKRDGGIEIKFSGVGRDCLEEFRRLAKGLEKLGITEVEMINVVPPECYEGKVSDYIRTKAGSTT